MGRQPGAATRRCLNDLAASARMSEVSVAYQENAERATDIFQPFRPEVTS